MADQWQQLTASAVVDSTGTATVYITPQAAGTYQISLLAVSVSIPGTRSSVAKIYRESVSQNSFVQGTNSGDADTDTVANLRLTTGQQLVCQWTGATVGAVAFLRAEGTFNP